MAKTLSELERMNPEEKALYRDYSEDVDAHDDAIENYDAYEAMDNGFTYDPVSKKTGNGLTDNMTSTIYLERAARVAGQLPEGETRAFGKKDYGKGMFLDILRRQWIYPNANAQFDFLTKMYMWQYGSSEYNVMPMFVDLNLSPTGYFGPDCWLWSPRNFIPQSGETSITDMDHVHAIIYKGADWFQDILDDEDDDSYDKDAIRSIMSQIKEATRETDPKRDTVGYRERMRQSVRQVEIATRYESGKDGRWITFLPTFGCKVIRNIKNPHKNARIPFVIKRCIPKFDSYYGVGDFQRSMPMQFANDGLDNFYFQGIKINLFPATMVNMQTAVPHTISNEPGSIWEFNGQPDARRLETSTAGLSTYQAAKGMSKGAIQSIAGTTDTRSNAESASDPGFGKTPEALKQIAERESTRDNQDRRFLESAMTELIDLMYSILPTIEEEIPVDMFSQEINEIIESGYTDLAKMFTHFEDQGYASFRLSESGNQMRIKVRPDAFKGITARFQLKHDSTYKMNKQQTLQSIMDFWGFIGKMPNALQQYQEATGKVPDWEYTFSEIGKLMDLPFMSKMFTTPQMPQQPATPAGTEGMPTGNGVPPAGGTPAPTGVPMPEGVPQPPQAPPMPEYPPEVLQASPQTPFTLGQHQFTDPDLAAQAYDMYQMAMNSVGGQ